MYSEGVHALSFTYRVLKLPIKPCTYVVLRITEMFSSGVEVLFGGGVFVLFVFVLFVVFLVELVVEFGVVTGVVTGGV